MILKRKSIDRSNWSRIAERRFAMMQVANDAFTGIVSWLALDEVRAPLVVTYGGEKRLCIADSGYVWMQTLPAGEPYAVLTVFDAKGAIVQWYIDICKQQGVSAEGIPWFDDLYLDVIALPTGEVILKDADELEEALQTGDITQAEYELAWREANRIMNAIEEGSFRLLSLSEPFKNEFDRRYRWCNFG